jgi:hypothetical protein
MKAGFKLCGSIKGGIMNIAKLTMHFGTTFKTGKYLLKEFKVHDSLHLGNVYIRLKVQRDAH